MGRLTAPTKGSRTKGLGMDDLVIATTCDTENIKCMYGECSECKDLSCPVSNQYNAESQTSPVGSCGLGGQERPQWQNI